MGEFIMKAWLSLKTKKAMKGGGACGIHRAMKYRSVDIRIKILSEKGVI